MDDIRLSHVIVFVFCLAIVVGGGWGGCAGYKQYSVWSQSKDGEAELAKAEWSKRVAVEEAKARKDSAVMNAEAALEEAKGKALAEIERAKGVAEANRIIGESLKGNDDYLRYLWIQGLNDGSSEVIYIPTEANLPIMEANRLKK